MTEPLQRQPTSPERQLSAQIFSVSAGLVGVCLTVVGLLNVFQSPSKPTGIADNLVAVDATFFLLACVFAYLALRTDTETHWRRLEYWADRLFLLALTGMVGIVGLIAYELL